MVAGASIGAILRERREALGASLAEVEAATKIRQKYLSALEADEWQALPGEVVGRGFLRNYASYLGLEPTEVIERRRSVADPTLSSALAATSAGSDLPPMRQVDYRPKDVDLRDEPESLEERTPPRVGPLLGVLAAIAVLVVLWWGLSRYGDTLLDGATAAVATVTETVSGWFAGGEPEDGLAAAPEADAAALGNLPAPDSTSVFGEGATGGERSQAVDAGVAVAPDAFAAAPPEGADPAAAEAAQPAPEMATDPAALPAEQPVEAAAPAPTPEPPTPTPLPPTPAPVPVVVNVQANLRAGPSTETEIVGAAQLNETVNVIGKTADSQWYRLASGAWIFGQLLTAPPETIPVIDPNAPLAVAEPAAPAADAAAPVDPAQAALATCGDPRSVLTSPTLNQTVAGVVPILGTATHENFASYKLEAGTPGAKLAFIGSGNTQISGGQLGNLDSRSFPNGNIIVRLTVIDQAGNYPPPCDVAITIQN